MANITLGMPYEETIRRAIQEGFATSRGEVIRQALARYGEELDEMDELRLVDIAVKKEMKKAGNNLRDLDAVIARLERRDKKA